MAARTLSVQNARRPVYHAAPCSPSRPGRQRSIRRPAERPVSAYPQPQRSNARAAAPAPTVYRRPRPAAHAPARRRRKRHTLALVLGKLMVLALCAAALFSVFDLLAQHRLLASMGSLATGQTIANPAPETAFASGSGMLTVRTVLQKPALPNGCEAASLATLLEYSGYPVDLAALAEDYLPRQSFTYNGLNRYGPDPETAYAGNPASSSDGWYCFEGPIIEAANAYLRDQSSDLRAESETGADMARLEQLLRQGTPVAVWFTQDYEQPRFNNSFTWTLPNGRTYTPYANLHCVVLTGMDETCCYLADPLQGDTLIDRSQFESIYTAMGSRAVVLR